MTRPCDRERPHSGRWLTLGLMTLALATQLARSDEDPCAGFSWNVAQERALFASAPQSVTAAVTAARDAPSAALLAPGRLYQLQLAPQRQVRMRLPPGKKTQSEGGYAGLARLQLTQAGAYRVSLDQGAWIDIVADGQMIGSSDFQGRPGCTAPHKIVLFLLPAGHELLLQVSAASGPMLRVAITPVE